MCPVLRLAAAGIKRAADLSAEEAREPVDGGGAPSLSSPGRSDTAPAPPSHAIPMSASHTAVNLLMT